MEDDKDNKSENALLTLLLEMERKEYFFKTHIRKFLDRVEQNKETFPVPKDKLNLMEELTKKLENSYPSKINSHETLVNLFQLGFLTGQHTPVKSERIKARNAEKLEINEARRKLPLKLKSICQRSIKSIIQVEGEKAWKEERYKDFKVSEMSKHLYPIVIDQIHCLMGEVEDPDGSIREIYKKNTPKDSDSLKKPLREIAPDHARKPGPKKRK